MKAFSLWQPWASLWIAPEAKIHETRSWPTKHRGELAIHAAKTLVPASSLDELALPEVYRALGFNLRSSDLELVDQYWRLPTGAIIAVVTIDYCMPTDSAHVVNAIAAEWPAITPRDHAFGNWTPGRFAWGRGPVVRALRNPVPCRGFQGIWNLTPEIEAQVREQLRATEATA